MEERIRLNVQKLSNRLEIAFWSLVITLLTEIPALGRLIQPFQEALDRLSTPRVFKRVAALWVSLCAAALLLLGFIAWRAAAGAPEAVPEGTAGEPASPSGAVGPSPVYPASGQRNLLVIGADDLQRRDPQLESVWLVLFVENSPQLTLLPLYPTGSAERFFEKRDSLARSFELTPQGEPGEAFLEALESRDIWWNGYVLLDRTAMARIVEMFASGAGGQAQGEAPAALDEIPSPRREPLEALAAQAKLAQELCARSRSLSPTLETAGIFELIPQHLVTDLDPEQALLDWSGLLQQGGGFSCEMPTLPGLLAGSR